MTEELKPCPFCPDGGAPELWIGEYDAHVFCSKCGTHSKSSGCGHKDDMKRVAIKNWNTRRKRTCKVENTGFATGLCSACGVEFIASVVNNIQPDCVEQAHFCPHCGAEIVQE